ncbi:MAG: hypothetical protein H0X08_07670 [Blastocatellia bacterium]|nr:hypothetical protein [Blastocatellia bacterium]
MVTSRSSSILVGLICISIWLIGCGDSANRNAPIGNPELGSDRQAGNARTNAEELRVFINIPQETEDIVWREFPAEEKLVAVMRLSKEDASEVAGVAGRTGGANKVSVQVENWFPDELVAQADMSGDGTVPADSYPATGFLLEPYTNGTIARIANTDYFIIEAFAR